MTLGAYLKAKREAAGLSPADVAAAVGWRTTASVYLMEGGSHDVPREKLGDLLRALGVPEDEWSTVINLPRTVMP